MEGGVASSASTRMRRPEARLRLKLQRQVREGDEGEVEAVAARRAKVGRDAERGQLDAARLQQLDDEVALARAARREEQQGHALRPGEVFAAGAPRGLIRHPRPLGRR